MRYLFTMMGAVALCFCMLAVLVRGESTPQADQLQRLQGKWESELTEQGIAAGLRRVVKEIKGQKETVTYYGKNHEVLRAHTVDFKLSKTGDIHVFTYSNMEVIEGQGKGQKQKES